MHTRVCFFDHRAAEYGHPGRNKIAIPVVDRNRPAMPRTTKISPTETLLPPERETVSLFPESLAAVRLRDIFALYENH
jgi:hypothetical protein